MSYYIKLSTNEYPRHIGDIEIDPTGMTDYAVVNWTEKPAYNIETQRCNQGKPELIDGNWFMTWVVREATQSEILILQTPKPRDDKSYVWSESQLAWVEIT
jgi:hypothetical protein